MDDETADLIARLCTRAGMMMEDASPVALTISILDDGERAQALRQLSLTVEQMEHLISAAMSLSR